ncbi:Kanadaptin [Sesbania bispinosa]|nr:Kanadaptin [Sesbania bispinosa]
MKMREVMLDKEASLQRARLEASLAEGISWGMGEDAIEEDEDDADEITWQTYKGQLTEKQEKTSEKIIKRMEKIANMKKEINSIRVKDISQGGLTQGQQTQIARNEQRITQIMEELENLEETLNDSIRESIENTTQDEVDDSLDAYMSGLSSQLVHDKSVQLEKELSTLQSELDRISYLLKIADPTGETAKKRELKLQEPKPKKSEEVASTIKKKPPAETQKSSEPCVKVANKKPVETEKINEACVKVDGSVQGEKPAAAAMGLDRSEPGCDRLEAENAVYTVPKPQWLGAVEDRVTDDNQQVMAPLHPHEMDESNQFVDYKDRNKILGSGDGARTSAESKIESAAPGEQMAEDAVALLLKHKKGLYANEDEKRCEGQERKPKRVLGPERPSFLSDEMDYDTSWVPPEGQSGDGRTSLNDKYGY